MKYLNQLEHPDISYPTDLDTPDSTWHYGSIKEAGCGICSMCMVVDRLCARQMTLRQCANLSHKAKADRQIGTDLKRLGPLVAEKYALDYCESDDIQRAVRCLQEGGCVVANVGGDQPDRGYTGLFSHGGHYITLISAADGEVCVLDPSWREGKYEEKGREGKVRMDGPFVYCPLETLDEDASSRSPRYYLFRRPR